MNIEEIQTLWDKDCQINELKLAEESMKTISLHSKYLRLHSQSKIQLLKLQQAYKFLYFEKKEFLINPTKETMNQHNWQIPDRGKLLKNEIDSYLQGDKELLKLELKIGIEQEKVDYLKSILQAINSRTFIIKNAIEDRKWMAGQ
jgi:transposase